MTRCFIYMFLASVSLLLSCGGKPVRERLTDAERLLYAESYDSAAWLLEEQIIPSALTDSDKADYGLLLAWAHLMQRRSLVNDSIINYSLEYYKTHGSDRLTFAYYLKSFYINDTKGGLEVKQALLREAIDSAYARRDTFRLTDLYQLLVSSSFNAGLHKEAIRDARKWEDSPIAVLKEMAHYMAGLSYARLDKRDSADYYLRMAVDSVLAKDMGWYAFHFTRNYADFLSSFDPHSSLYYLRLLEERFPEREAPGSYVMPWINLGRLDSARKYVERDALNVEKNYKDDIASYALNFAYRLILDAKENKPMDVSRLGRYCDSLSFASRDLMQVERERLIDQNRLRQDNMRLEMKRQRTFSLLVIVLLVSFLVSGGVAVYIRGRRNRLIEAEERLDALRQLLEESKRSMAEEEKPDSAFFRKVLLQQLGIIRLMATSPTQQNKELLQQMSRITNEDVPVDTLLVWDDLYPIIDGAYDNFYTRLVRLSAGRLLEKEIQLCCLLCAGFSTKEISVVTQQSVRTIYQRKTDIRHKLGMDEKEDIVAFINA